MVNIQKIFGENLRRNRIKSGLSQATLARKAGLSPVYINRIEQGNVNVSLKNIFKIISALDIQISDLFYPLQNNQYKAIIFDLHYTILRLYPSRGILYQKIFKKHGFNSHPREINKTFSEIWSKYGDEKIAETSLSHYREKTIEQWWFNFHFEMLKKLGLRDKGVAKIINQDISSQFYSNPRVHKMYSDAKKILPYLKKHGIKLALVTNGYKSTKQIIEYFKINKYFDYILISCDIGISKPNSKLYRLVANKFSINPQEILCVGDSYPTDVVGAKKAGCGVAIIDRKNVEYKKKYDCIYLNNLMQIKNLITFDE